MGNKTYAGIGSKKAGPVICSKAQRLGYYLANREWTLYSSHSPNFEVNLELGADASSLGETLIFLPHSGYNGALSNFSEPLPFSYAIAQELYSEWDSLNFKNKTIISNVCHQILGRNLESPVSFVLCWTEDGSSTFHDIPSDSGPVYFGIKLASMVGIPVFNLGSDTWRDRFITHLDKHASTTKTMVGHIEENVDTYIGRKCYGFKESIFANSYKLSDFSIKDCLSLYYKSILDNPVKLHLAKLLQGKKLGCYCRHLKQDHPVCHGDVLSAIAENTSVERIIEGDQVSLIE